MTSYSIRVNSSSNEAKKIISLTDSILCDIGFVTNFWMSMFLFNSTLTIENFSFDSVKQNQVDISFFGFFRVGGGGTIILIWVYI